MNRIRIERSSVVGLLLAAALWQAALPASAQGESSRDRARAHFDRGVGFAKTSAYEAALAEFERAYELLPHYGVLYNIGQAQLALGRTAQARASFERYLREGGGAVPAARRAEVEALLARLPAAPNTPPPETHDFPPEPAETPSAPAAPSGSAAAGPRSPDLPAPVVTPAKVEARTPALPLSEPIRPIQSDRSATSVERTLAYVLGGASVALAGAAVGHYLWNRGRYRDWQSDQQSYELAPTEPQRVSINELGRSIRRASVVTVALSIGASLTLSTSVVLFVSGKPAASPQHGNAFQSTFGVRGSF